ncbi:branched-chain amino acid aminotransferase [Amylibacter kogurei]|uniref:Branched-chain amino acid aminotransferase n=1 Tax=Paramylibacter kogurei TaxID=1889778 RepID=A0A2G5KAE4_9RHOB|nr:sulfotransferase family protein [Amylibacter kogurei]PIB26487.1 branched-chain amino acid aminotransferase [Amylibacter kogurei]
MRIAMWSGPRNLSTAMLYSFGARSDCAVWDEPYYGAYLHETGLEHPMGAEIMAQWSLDSNDISTRCLGEIPDHKSVFYQKHMCHHMIPKFDRTWIAGMTNVFLIRHPARVLASYAAKRENPSLDDIGFRQQGELFKQLCDTQDTPPVVIDSFDIRENPEKMLRKLCDAIGLNFEPAMLSWPKGGHKDDGPWAPHWYPAVHNSTGFAGVEGPLPSLSDELATVCEQAMPYYEDMAKFKI